MSEPEDSELLIVGGSGPRKRGRPRVADPLERVSTRLPVGHYDRLVKVATRREQSVSELVRQILMAQKFLSR